ncbi:MAG: peptidoglycan DD-metalloendopeptidase family protein [Candidatus Kerfeldbacteria bacterium]|nr:peptidoglycan DD-metalloendopeptidase family protein [Candidatus Kerfeldbacteria bacterium]
MNKTKTYRLAFLATALLAASFFVVSASAEDTSSPDASTPDGNTPAAPADVSDLETQIREKQSKIISLEQQQKIYESSIAQKQQESLSLQNQIAVLDDQIATTDLTIQKLNLEIESLDLELQELATTIEEKERAIAAQKTQLGELLRTLHRYEQRTMLEVSLTNETFSQFFNQLKYLQSIEAEAKRSLDRIQLLKADLEQQRDEQQKKRDQQNEKRGVLVTEKSGLESQQAYRESLLDDTKNSEQRFEGLLEQSKQEQLSANTDIQRLEAEIRRRLEGKNELPKGPTDLAWPISSRRITSYFHDPSYIFRKYFEHPAIDVATPQGTALRAAASGYVARAKNAGLGYSYIMIVHGNKLSTVYGHVSQISVVEDDFIVQGQVIGYSGGTPGTPGAGRLTTGPHLHFEVRLDGIPQNPLNYLP